jgi:hypothetical protein
MASPIKIKHAVYATEDAVNNLYNILVDTALAIYPDTATQAAALLAAKASFEIELNNILHKAFKTGKKIGKEKADDADSSMYAAQAGQ